jgi:hypothetical protein
MLSDGRVYAVYQTQVNGGTYPIVYRLNEGSQIFEELSTSPVAQSAFGAIGVGNSIYTIGGGDYPKRQTVHRYRAY